MEENKKIFNLVYDNWDDTSNTPVPNTKNVFGDEIHFYIDSYGIVDHWVNISKRDSKFKIKKCKIEDVAKYPDQNFYYMVGVYVRILRDFLSGKSPLNETVLHYLKNYKNFKVIFHSEHEADDYECYLKLIEYIKEYDLNEEQFYLINNNAKLDEYKIKVPSKINVHSIQFVPSSSTIVLENLGGCDFIDEKSGKFFMCFNRSPKLHRICLLGLMHKNGLLQETNWSFIPHHPPTLSAENFSSLFNILEYEDLKNDIDKIIYTKIKHSDYEADKNWFSEYSEFNRTGLPIWMLNPDLVKNYQESYFNIVTESHFEDYLDTIHISEKSFKPFYYYQFPMILASNNHIKKIVQQENDYIFFENLI